MPLHGSARGAQASGRGGRAPPIMPLTLAWTPACAGVTGGEGGSKPEVESRSASPEWK